jgi:hypothetical protein
MTVKPSEPVKEGLFSFQRGKNDTEARKSVLLPALPILPEGPRRQSPCYSLPSKLGRFSY